MFTFFKSPFNIFVSKWSKMKFMFCFFSLSIYISLSSPPFSLPALLHQVSKSPFRSSRRVWRRARSRNRVYPLPKHPKERGGAQLSSSSSSSRWQPRGGSDSQLTSWPRSRSSWRRSWCTATAAVRARAPSWLSPQLNTEAGFSSSPSVSLVLPQAACPAACQAAARCPALAAPRQRAAPGPTAADPGSSSAPLPVHPPAGLLCAH